jgi:hypothetical protein
VIVRELNYALDILADTEVDDDTGLYACCGGQYEGAHVEGCQWFCPYDDEDEDDGYEYDTCSDCGLSIGRSGEGEHWVSEKSQWTDALCEVNLDNGGDGWHQPVSY